MNAVTVFFCEVAACVAISTFILFRLQRLLRELASAVCELALVGRAVWKSIVRPAAPAPSSAAASPA